MADDPLKTIDEAVTEATDTVVAGLHRRYMAWVAALVVAWTGLVVSSTLAVTMSSWVAAGGAAVFFVLGCLACWRGTRAGDRWGVADRWRQGNDPDRC